LTPGVIIQAVSPHRGPKYADQAVTGRSRGVCRCKVFDAQGRSYGFLGLYELEILGRALGLISGGMVGREAVKL
jgi:hypothetical protein